MNQLHCESARTHDVDPPTRHRRVARHYPRRIVNEPLKTQSSASLLGSRALRWTLAAIIATLSFLGLGSGLAGATTPAPADNLVQNSSPANGTGLSTSPMEIVIGFVDELGELNTIALSCETNTVALPPLEVLDDKKTLRVDIPEVLPKGTCTATWTVSDKDDTRTTSGVLTFVVQNDPPEDSLTTNTSDTPADATTPTSTPGIDPTVAAAAASDSPEILDFSTAGRGHAAVWLGRLISTIGIATLFGSLLIIAAAWPEGVEYLVTIKFLRAVWIVALVGTLLFAAAAASVVTPDGGGSGFSPGSWLDLASAGWAGRAVLLRLVLLLASAWVAFRPDRVIDPTSQIVAIAIPGLCAATLGISRTVGDLPAVGVALGVVHALAMSVWVGGVILLARVVLSGPGEEDLVHAVRGFGRVSTPAIAITIVTGVIQMFRLDGGAMFDSGHGRLVVFKAVVVAVMIFVAISARQFVAQRLNRAQMMSVPLADRLRRAFGAEAGIGIVTLALSSWLLAFVPSGINTTPSIAYQLTQSHMVEDADLDVQVSLTDTDIGLAGIQVEVKKPADGLSNLVVILTAPPNDLNVGSIRQPVPLTGAGVAVRAEEIGLPISVPGTWTIQVDATTASGAVSSAPQTFVVSNVDGTSPSSVEQTRSTVTVVIADTTPSSTPSSTTGG